MIEVLSSLTWLRPALDVARLVVFACFVALGIRAARAPGRRPVDRLLAFVLVVSLAVGISQVEAWPFSNWALVHHLAPRQVTSWEIEATDETGRTWAVDARILQPLAPEEFGAWMLAHVKDLSPAGRASLGAFLLARAEAGRQALRAGRAGGGNERLLGPLAAPFHFAQKPVWRAVADVPAVPFSAVRITLLDWDVEARARDESQVVRRAVLRYPEP